MILVPKINPELFAAKEHEACAPNWVLTKIIELVSYDMVLGQIIKCLAENNNSEGIAAVLLSYDLINAQLEINAMEEGGNE